MKEERRMLIEESMKKTRQISEEDIVMDILDQSDSEEQELQRKSEKLCL